MAVPLFATKFLKYFSRNFPKYFSRKFQNISPEIMRGRIYGLTKLHNHRQSLKFLFSNILKTSWVMSFCSWLNSTFWVVFPLRNLFLFLSCFVWFLSNSCFLDAIKNLAKTGFIYYLVDLYSLENTFLYPISHYFLHRFTYDRSNTTSRQ